jgi:iron(III) transport system permease protein
MEKTHLCPVVRKLLFGVLALVLLAPILTVLTAPLHAPAPEWDFVKRAILPRHLVETGRLLVLSVGLAALFGTVSAWLVSSARFPGQRLFRWALMLPLALPTYIGSITFAALLGPTGSLSNALRSTGIDIDILTPAGLAVTFALLLYPYVYLPARAAFAGGMGDVLEAARLLGAGPIQRAWRVAIPMARPAIAAGSLLVAMEALNDYGAVSHYGVHTLTVGIFRSWGGLYDTGSALRIAAILVVMVAVIAGVEARIGRHARRTSSHTAFTPTVLRGWRAWAATTWCAVLLGVAFVLPVGALVHDAMRTAGMAAWQQLSAPLGNTVLLAVLSAALTLVIALVFAYGQRRGSAPLARLASMGYVVPGAVIAIGTMALAGWATTRTGWPLIGTWPLIVYAFAVRFLAMAYNPLLAGLAQQPRAYDEAARMLGASPLRAFLRIHLPLLRPSLIAAAAITLIEVIKELPLTLILRPFGLETLSTHIFYQSRIEQWDQAAVPALLIVAVGFIPVYLLERALER